MRHQWRVFHLLLRAHKSIPNHSQVLRSFSSIPPRFTTTTTTNSTFPLNPSFRCFSSELALAQPDSDHAVIADIFSKHRDLDDIKNHLDSNHVSINHDAINAVLWKLVSDSDTARRFFRWVSENHPERLSSKSYNAMLRVIGTNGFVDEFWDLIGIMKKKGYGVSGVVRERVLECFEKGGMDGDAKKLKDLFDNNTVERNCSSLCRIVRHNVWGDDVERQIRDLNVGFTSELVKLVLENLGSEPNKALIFFRWVEEGGTFKHDGCTYNVMARVLGREDSIDRFWKLVGDMRSAGFEMEFETFVKVLGRFCKRRMIKDAVELYEFAMAGANKPSPPCCTFLLRKVVSSKELDMDLFSRVVKVFTESGNALTDSMAEAVLKSLTSVGRIGEWNKVLKEMEDCGFVASRNLRSKIAFRLGASGNKEKANEFVSRIEASGSNPDHKTWQSLVEGHCVGGNLDKAFDSFKEMVEKEGVASAGYTFDLLMNSYCQMNRAIDASKILCQLVNEKEVKPRHSTYKLLVTKLLAQGGFVEASNILGLMKNHGFIFWVEGHCVGGNLDKAFDSFKEMVEKEGVASAGYTFDLLMNSYCQMNRAIDASKILCQLVNEKEVKPRHSTYKLLVTKLLAQGGFVEASNILGLMKNHGFPPFTDPFIEHVSKRGSGDDAVLFLKAMTSKRFPSTSVYLRMFDAFFKQGRHEEAQNFLSKCPGYVRNHADVLNLFCSMKNSKEAASSGMLAA